MPSTPEVDFGFGVKGEQPLLAVIKELRREMLALKQQQDGLASSSLNLANAWGTMVRLAGLLEIAKIGRDAFETAVSIGKMQQITGLTARALSVYYKAAEDVGIAHEQVDKALQKAAKSLLGLQEGSKQSAAGYALLHLSAKDFVGLSNDQAIQKITDRLGTMKDSLAKAAAAQAIFGKSGAQLIPVLNQLAGTGFEAVATQANRLGLIFTNEMTASALHAAGALHDLKGDATGAAAQFETGLLPALADTADALVHATTHGGNGFKTLGEMAGKALKWIAESFILLGLDIEATAKQFVQIWGWATGEVKNGVGTVFQSFALAAKGDFSGAWESIKQGARNSVNEYQDAVNRIHAIRQAERAAAAKAHEDLYNNKSPRKDVDRSGAPGNPNAGGSKGAFDLDRAKANEAKSAAQRDLELYRAFAHEKEEQDKNEYYQGIISLQEYFQRRADTIREERALELKALGAEKTGLQGLLADVEKTPVAAGDKNGEAQKQRTILDLKNQIADAENKMVIATANGEAKLDALGSARHAAERDHQEKVLEFEAKLAELQGNKVKAAQLLNQLEEQRMRLELQQQLGPGHEAEIAAKLAAYASARDTRAAGDQAKTGFEDKYAEFERKKSVIQGKSSGPDAEPAYQVERQLAALYRSEIPLLQEKSNQLRHQADLARQQGNTGLADELDKQADGFDTKIASMRSELTKMDVSWRSWQTGAKSAIDQASSQMTTGLNGMITAHERFGQAVAKTWNEMVMTGIRAAEKLAAHFIAMELKKLLFKRMTDQANVLGTAVSTEQQAALEKKGGIKAVFVAAKVAAAKAWKAHAENPIVGAIMAALTFAGVMAFGAFAEGGRVIGPGTGTSDSIPAMLSHGEHVVTARAASVLGHNTLDVLNSRPQDFAAALSGANLPPMRQAALYGPAGLSRIAGSTGAFKSQPAGAPVSFSHTTHIDGLQALDGASVRAALEEHGDLIGDIAVGAVKGYMRQNGVNR